MIPGYLPESANTNQPPSGRLLPEQFVARYSEGGDRVILGSTELDFTQINLLFVTSFVRERFGYGLSAFSSAYVRILNIDLVQPDVFGVLLLDSFTPPAIANEFFEFPAYVQDSCVGCIPPLAVLLSMCAEGEDVVDTETPDGVFEPTSEVDSTDLVFAEVVGTDVVYTEE